jgi:hypothetical protein
MAAFQNTVTIARPADEVFAFLADFGNIPAWNYAIARTVQTSPGPARVGATYRQTRTVPHRSEEGFQVTKWKASPFPDCGNCILLSRYLRFQELVADLLRRPVPVR